MQPGSRWLSARGMLRGGLLLVLLGVVSTFLPSTLVVLWGQDAINTPAFTYGSHLLGVLERLGVGLIVFSLVVRHLEDVPARDQSQLDDDHVAVPWKPTPRQTLIGGVALTLLGLVIIISSYDWLYQVDPGLLRDFLSYVALPLKDAILLTGILLIPCSLVIRAIQLRTEPPSGGGGGQSAAARVP